ncbi:ArsR family transcriptional regulator [Candidatus Bathyarchaeota archaeon]|nr:ArsR family transcriptional regulator [Candidatus Bathyarchaeota archaeon]
MRKAIHFVNDSKEIQLLANFKHREILQLLSEHPMTQTELSKTLGLTKSAIGYHLKQLMQANFIYIIKVEIESHGIQQKFYSPIASLIIASLDRTPDNIKRYFIQVQIEHVIGILAAFQSVRAPFDINSETIEKLALMLWKQLEQTCKKYESIKVIETAESLKIKIYTDALNKLTTSSEWKALLPLS